MTRIITVTVRKLWNTGNYQNVSCELAAEIDEEADPMAELDQLEWLCDDWFKNRQGAKDNGGNTRRKAGQNELFAKR